jgi:Tfp pilus assembly protein PilZ
MSYRRRALILDDEAGEIGDLALRLVRLGIDSHYANDLEEAVLLTQQEQGDMGAVVIPASRAEEWIPLILKRLNLPSAAIVPAGARPPDTQIESMRVQGLRWALWNTDNDRALRFVVSAAMSETHDDEIRFDLRVPTVIEATASRGPLNRPCLIQSLSNGGAVVALDPPVSVGGRVELAFEIAGESLALPAKVMWSSEADANKNPDVEPAMGVEFGEIETGALGHIESFLSRERKVYLL